MESKVDSIITEIARLNRVVSEQTKEIQSLNAKVKVLEGRNEQLLKENKRLLSENNNLINDEMPEIRNFNIPTKTSSYSDVSESDEEIKGLISNDRESRNDERRLSLSIRSSNSIPFSPLIGMRDTFSIFTFSSVLTKEKKENQLRKLAFEGNAEKLSEILTKDQSIVNGRGMPDSICSRFSSFYDKTALMLAAKQGKLSCVKELIKHDADPNLWDRDKLTALDYSERNGHVEVSSYLRANKALNAINVPELKEEMTNRFKLS